MRKRTVARPSSRAYCGSLSDHLIGIGAQQNRFGDRDAEFLCGFEVDYEIELRRLLDRQVAWLGALQDFVDILCRSAEQVGVTQPKGHKAARVNLLPIPVDGW
jgi:hypothetical protein